MQISVVIPTYNRIKDLSECLDSIIQQTLLPKDVIIIDNSNNDNIKKLVDNLIPIFASKNIILKYIYNDKENSLTVAKNLGVKYASEDIISFLDDDIILHKDYYQEIIKVFKKNHQALGVEGKVIFSITERKYKFLFNQIFGRLFYLGFLEKNKARVLPSLGLTYPLEDKVINCQWLSGASVFKRIVFDEFIYDENLKKYSDGEDIDFSYRIFKKYPNSLFIAPKAKYVHKISPIARGNNKERVYMKEIYSLYIFFKVIKQNFKNNIIYLWSRFGEFIFKIILVIMLKVKSIEIIYLLKVYSLCIKHLRDIKSGNLYFFNKTLDI